MIKSLISVSFGNFAFLMNTSSPVLSFSVDLYPCLSLLACGPLCLDKLHWDCQWTKAIKGSHICGGSDDRVMIYRSSVVSWGVTWDCQGFTLRDGKRERPQNPPPTPSTLRRWLSSVIFPLGMQTNTHTRKHKHTYLNTHTCLPSAQLRDVTCTRHEI